MGRWADGPSWNFVVDSVGRSGEYNMATDEGLLDEVVREGGAYLRLYCWDPPTLSLGRNQPNTFRDVPTVRRPTGGHAVWHAHEVTYSVAAPIAVFGSLRQAYGEIHARIARGLRALGVETSVAPPSAHRPIRPSAHPGSCFARAVGGEILVHGKKLVGSAQVRRGDAFLQHGSILLSGTQQIVSTAGGETTLAQALGRQVAFDEVVRALVAHWPSGHPAVRPSPFQAALIDSHRTP